LKKISTFHFFRQNKKKRSLSNGIASLDNDYNTYHQARHFHQFLRTKTRKDVGDDVRRRITRVTSEIKSVRLPRILSEETYTMIEFYVNDKYSKKKQITYHFLSDRIHYHFNIQLNDDTLRQIIR
jgi:hypothetical protein